MKNVQPNELNIDNFTDTLQCVSVGRLNKEMIDFIVDKKQDFRGRLSEKTDILFWSDRIKHTLYHTKYCIIKLQIHKLY